MKILVAFILLISSYGNSQTLEIFASTYGEQVDIMFNDNDQRFRYIGGGLDFRYSLDEPGVRWIGSEFGINYDGVNGTVFRLGFILRTRFFNEFLKIDIKPPFLNMPVADFKLNKYNTPYGFELYLFRGDVTVSIEESFYNNGIVSRLCVNWKIK